jgi:DNA-binding Lrp family transcriptional regulator
MGEIWMVEAYILVKISVQKEVYGYARSVVEKLMMMKGVENAQLLFGDYDAIAKLNAPKTHDVENLVIEEISMIEGIESTITLLCVDKGILE